MDEIEFGKEFRPFEFGLGGQIHNKRAFQFQSPEEKFSLALKVAVEQVSLFISIERSLEFKIFELSNLMDHRSFKNATAFVLGCIASKNHDSQTLDKNEVQKIFAIIHNFKESDNITEYDVIRYARFAMLNNFEH
jgi:hypothetical protein